MYLAPPDGGVQAGLAVGAFLPQAALILALAARFSRDLPFCLCMSTVAFVALNKVAHAQATCACACTSVQ